MLPCLFMCQLHFLHALCFVPCLDPSFLCVDVWIYMPTCLISYLWFLPCLDQHVCMHVLCSYAYVYAFTCLYAWVCVLPCLYVYIYMLRCISKRLHAHFHAYMCSWCIYMLRSMSSTCFINLSCACMLYALFMCLGLDFVCHAMCQPFCSFYHIFLCFGLMVRTRSRPYGFFHRPYTKAHIKGFGSFIFKCLCLLVSMLYACVSLSSSRL